MIVSGNTDLWVSSCKYVEEGDDNDINVTKTRHCSGHLRYRAPDDDDSDTFRPLPIRRQWRGPGHTYNKS